MFAVPMTAFPAASCLNQLSLLKEQFSISCHLYVLPYFFIWKSFNREFWMEKLRDGRNCLRGCGHSFENRRKTYFFHDIAYSLFFVLCDFRWPDNFDKNFSPMFEGFSESVMAHHNKSTPIVRWLKNYRNLSIIYPCRKKVWKKSFSDYA